MPTDALTGTGQRLTIDQSGVPQQIVFHMHQEVAASPAWSGGRPRQPRKKADQEAKRQQIRELIRQGKSGNEIDDLVSGGRSEILRLVRQVRAEFVRADAESHANG
jgi:hypothetical protein